jgi:hypothetical protein
MSIELNDQHRNSDISYIDLLRLRKKYAIYEVAALVLNIDPRYLKIMPDFDPVREYFSYEYQEQSGYTKYYYPAKADQYDIDTYLLKEYPRGQLIPEGTTLGEYRPSMKDFMYQELKGLMMDAVREGTLPLAVSTNDPILDEKIRKAMTNDPQEGFSVEKEQVLKWFDDNKLKPAFFFESKQQSTSLPKYLDKNHPEHSLELGIAVEAWQRFSGLGITHPKEYFEKWLKETFDETLSEKAIERIITLTNWNKGGGAKATSFKSALYQQALDKEIPIYTTSA